MPLRYVFTLYLSLVLCSFIQECSCVLANIKRTASVYSGNGGTWSYNVELSDNAIDRNGGQFAYRLYPPVSSDSTLYEDIPNQIPSRGFYIRKASEAVASSALAAASQSTTTMPTHAAPTSSGVVDPSPSNNGLSTGAKAGIAIGVVAMVLLGAIALFLILRHRRRPNKTAELSANAGVPGSDKTVYPQHDVNSVLQSQHQGNVAPMSEMETPDISARPEQPIKIHGNTRYTEVDRGEYELVETISTPGTTQMQLKDSTDETQKSYNPLYLFFKKTCIFWVNSWTAEALSCALAVIALICLIATLKYFEGTVTTRIPLNISINTLVSIYAATIKASLLLPVAEGTSHLDLFC